MTVSIQHANFVNNVLVGKLKVTLRSPKGNQNIHYMSFVN